MIIHECRSCKHWHGEFLCVCIESEFYHNPRLGADGCEQWVPYGAKSG